MTKLSKGQRVAVEYNRVLGKLGRTRHHEGVVTFVGKKWATVSVPSKITVAGESGPHFEKFRFDAVTHEPAPERHGIWLVV